MLRKLLLVLLVAAAPAFATEPSTGQIEKKGAQPTCEELKAQGAGGEVLARRGCCSWHSGVCGCSGGRVVCCDSSYSPSCLCNHDDPQARL